MPGIRAVRLALEQASPGSESVGETPIGVDLRALGYEFDRQVKVRVGSRVFRADGQLKGEPVLWEFDGVGKYFAGASPTLDATATLAEARERLRSEKERHDALVASGYAVARFTWKHLGQRRMVNDEVAAARRRVGFSGGRLA